MNNISNLQTSKNATLQPSAPNKQSSSPQSQAFNSPKVPQQVTPLVQQLLQSSKEGKAGEHTEHTTEHLNNLEEDFQSELNEQSELVHAEDKEQGRQRDGDQQADDAEEDEENGRVSSAAQTPVSVSGGGVTVGVSISSTVSRPIPDSRVIAIQGQNYTVSFLKRQVGNYAGAAQGNAGHDPDSGAVSQAVVNTPWGGAGMAGSASQFESYIRTTFPSGDPSLSANPVVKYEGSTLVVAGQVYGASLNDPKLVGSADSFLVGHLPEHQAATQQVLGTFNELEVINDLTQADGSSSYMVRVPTEYYAQWQAALLDNLPIGSTVQSVA